MIKIYKADPTNTNFLRILYNCINDNKEEYADIDFDTVLECRDNIFIAAKDEMLTEGIFGIIMCRRINISDIEIKELLFHCQPHNIVYSVDAVYLEHPFSSSDERRIIFRYMIETNAASKKDAFILIKLPQSYKELLEETLIEMGCYLSGVVNNTFIKPPIDIT